MTQHAGVIIIAWNSVCMLVYFYFILFLDQWKGRIVSKLRKKRKILCAIQKRSFLGGCDTYYPWSHSLEQAMQEFLEGITGSPENLQAQKLERIWVRCCVPNAVCKHCLRQCPSCHMHYIKQACVSMLPLYFQEGHNSCGRECFIELNTSCLSYQNYTFRMCFSCHSPHTSWHRLSKFDENHNYLRVRTVCEYWGESIYFWMNLPKEEWSALWCQISLSQPDASLCSRGILQH